MKKNILLLCTSFLFILNTAMAFNGGGTVVGNGAGLVEGQFQNAYHSLEKILSNCFQTDKCKLLDDEKKLAIEIHEIVLKNISKKDRLVFLSEKLNPGFFTTGASEFHRIAKTGLDSNGPIYVNTDMLYDGMGRPAITYTAIISVLLHELGHQAGVLDHGALDIFGAKIAAYNESHTNYFSYNKPKAEESEINFSVTNFQLPAKGSVVIFNWKNQISQDLSGSIIGSSECLHPTESYVGMEISNGHFSINEKNNLFFRAWIDLSCYESFSDSIFIYRKNLKIGLDQDLKINGILVK